MASKAITGLWCEWAKAKRSMRNVAIDGIATRRGQAHPFCSTTAGAQGTYLEASKFPSALIHHHHHLHLPSLHQGHHWKWPICLLIIKNKNKKIFFSLQHCPRENSQETSQRVTEKVARSKNEIEKWKLFVCVWLRKRDGGLTWTKLASFAKMDTKMREIMRPWAGIMVGWFVGHWQVLLTLRFVNGKGMVIILYCVDKLQIGVS